MNALPHSTARQNNRLKSNDVHSITALIPLALTFCLVLVSGCRHSADLLPEFESFTPTNSFGIYHFAESVDWRQSTTDWETRELSPIPVISETDIAGYDFADHVVTLTPEAARRISEFQINGLSEPFVVIAQGERIYLGIFVSAVSSQSYPLPSLTLWGSQQFDIHTNLPPNSLPIERTYHSPVSNNEPDPRSDRRIRETFELQQKLE